MYKTGTMAMIYFIQLQTMSMKITETEKSKTAIKREMRRFANNPALSSSLLVMGERTRLGVQEASIDVLHPPPPRLDSCSTVCTLREGAPPGEQGEGREVGRAAW